MQYRFLLACKPLASDPGRLWDWGPCGQTVGVGCGGRLGAEGPARGQRKAAGLRARHRGGVHCTLSGLQSLVPGREVIGQMAFSNHLSNPVTASLEHRWKPRPGVGLEARPEGGSDSYRQRGLPWRKGALWRPLHTPVRLLTGPWSEACLWPSCQLARPLFGLQPLDTTPSL